MIRIIGRGVVLLFLGMVAFGLTGDDRLPLVSRLIGFAIWIGMGLLVLRWIMGGKSSPQQAPEPWAGSGDFDFEIVGEASYQRQLLKVAGPGDERGVIHHCSAQIQPEDGNPHDSNAVRVTIDGETVGYLTREDAKAYRKAHKGRSFEVPAVIVGGWRSASGDAGSYGVKLDFEL